MNNVEKARCYIDNFNKNFKCPSCCCFMQQAIPTLTIGTITTGEPGTQASASITGTAPNFVLNLTIPQGATGADGAAATVTVGTTTTGDPGTNAQVINSGTSSAAVLDFTIPRGNPAQ